MMALANGAFRNAKDAEGTLEFWRDALGLTNWQIQIKVVKRKEMPKSDNLACCQFYRDLQRATVYLLKRSDYPKDLLDVIDHEIDLVHELLHLVIPDVDSEEVSNEQGLNLVAQLLVELTRK